MMTRLKTGYMRRASLCVSADKFKAIAMESDNRDLISPPDVIHPDIVDEADNDHDDHTDVDYQQEKRKLEDLVILEGSPPKNKGPYDNQEVSPLPQKRPWPEEQIETLPLHAKDVPPSIEDTRLVKRMKTHDSQVYLPPAPKRATLASQQRQFKKLIAPFRSPLMLNKDEDTPSEDLCKSNNPLSILLAPPPAPKMPLTPQKPHPQHAHAAPSVTPAKTRVRTLKAASQFKSPLSSSASTSCGRGSSIRLTPTVQSLERKLQLLRRAVKVKENDEEKTLVGLVKKWTEAGREVAYELWDLAKDSVNKGVGSRGNGDGFNGTWGWDGGASRGRMGSRDQNWGWDSPGIKRESYPENEMDTATENLLDDGYSNKIHSEDDEQARYTMGTMLRQLGIATDTLGWDEDAEVFVN
ncbi:hypothetical protein DFH29DRAFT_851709 [Suillus ampliporus]|nr:hypothetical protein DFH29DRAFT_851709 [Suillus ampliporus]